MPRPKLIRVGPFTAALTAWDVWRRLSPAQRRWVGAQVRRHGPRIAKRAVDARRKPKPKP